MADPKKPKKSKNPKRSRLHSTSDVLQSLFQNSKSPLYQQFTRWKIWGRWAKIVGPDMAEHTAPVGYLNGRLFVWVDHSTRLQELTFIKRDLCKTINAHIGRKWIHSINFTLDRQSVPLTYQNNWKKIIEGAEVKTPDKS